MQPRPFRMGIGDMLDETFRLVQRNFALLAGLAAVLQIPLSLATALLVNGLVASDLQRSEQRLQDATRHAQGGAVNSSEVFKALLGISRDSALLLGLYLLLSVVVTGLLGGVFSLAVAERLAGRPARIGRCYAAAFHRLVPLAGVLLLRSLALAAVIALPVAAIVRSSGNLADELPDTDLASAHLSAAASHDLGILGIAIVALMPLALVAVFLYVRWAVCAQAVVLERRGVDGLARSWHLVGGSWWKSFGVLLIAFLFVTITSRIVTAVDGHILDALHLRGTARTVVQWVLDTLVAVVTLPIALTMQTLLFFDLKARKEGFDPGRLAADLEDR